MINLEKMSDQEIKELKKLVDEEHKRRGAKYKDDAMVCSKLVEMGFSDQLISEGFRGKDNPDDYYSEADHETADLSKIFYQLVDMCLGNYEVKVRKTRKDAHTGKDVDEHAVRRYNAFKTMDIYDEYLKTCDEFLKVFEKHFKKRVKGEMNK